MRQRIRTRSPCARTCGRALPLVARALGERATCAIVRGEKGQWRTARQLWAASGRSCRRNCWPRRSISECPRSEAAAGPSSRCAPAIGRPREMLAVYRRRQRRPRTGSLSRRSPTGSALAARRSALASRSAIAALARLEAILEIAARVESDARDGAAAGADGRGGHAAAGGRAGQHLPVGPAEPHARRPAGARRGREANCGFPTTRASSARWCTRGEPRRVDADVAAEQREIDRRVDQQLGFQTRTLLCVPLRGAQAANCSARSR